MGVTYYVIPLIFRRRVAFLSAAVAAVPVRHRGVSPVDRHGRLRREFRRLDVTGTSPSQAPFDVQFNPMVDLVLAVMGIVPLYVTGAPCSSPSRSSRCSSANR
ncbi:MAG: hypothetical protein U0163_09450 [Gemmatimonadaceae bacterium]